MSLTWNALRLAFVLGAGLHLAAQATPGTQTTTPGREARAEQRLDRQERRIEKGIASGQLTRREAKRLERVRRGFAASTMAFRLNQRYDIDARRGGNMSRFINHSCAPNCRSEKRRGRIWIVAERDIAPEEEITFDYGFPFRDWADNPCRCGSADCAGYIVAADQRWRLRRPHRTWNAAR